jgi:hypothetical protein
MVADASDIEEKALYVLPLRDTALFETIGQTGLGYWGPPSPHNHNCAISGEVRRAIREIIRAR